MVAATYILRGGAHAMTVGRSSALAPGAAPGGGGGPAPTAERTGESGGVGIAQPSGYLGDRQLGVEQQLAGECVMALLAELAIGGARTSETAVEGARVLCYVIFRQSPKGPPGPDRPA